jgi:plasmid stability protein
MMTRTQISLDPELLRQARKRAAEHGISLAAYVRGLLARDLSSGSPPADPSLVFDLGGSGGSDVAREKDAMIGEALVRRAP